MGLVKSSHFFIFIKIDTKDNVTKTIGIIAIIEISGIKRKTIAKTKIEK